MQGTSTRGCHSFGPPVRPIGPLFTRDDTGRGLESQPVDTFTLFEHIEVDGYNIHRYEVEVNGISAKNGFRAFAQGIEMRSACTSS